MEERIKFNLLRYLHKKDKNHICVPEVNIWGEQRVVIDMLCVNSKITIFEIKSQKDTTKRLERQVSKYKECADEIYIVADKKHIGKALEYEECGVMLIKPRGFEIVKEAPRLQPNIDELFYFLTFDELKETLRGVKGKKNQIQYMAQLIKEIIKDEEELLGFLRFKLYEKYLNEYMIRERYLLANDLKALMPRMKMEYRLYLQTPITHLYDIPLGALKNVEGFNTKEWLLRYRYAKGKEFSVSQE